MKESKEICRKVSFFAGEQKLENMKESKNVCKKTKICEAKQKYLQESKFISRKAKTLKYSYSKKRKEYLQESKNI